MGRPSITGMVAIFTGRHHLGVSVFEGTLFGVRFKGHERDM